jgi:putative ABC transport system ATP-binding protein
MIEAAGIQKVYEAGGLRVRALRGVDLGIRRGEMVAIMGPSGCGKTTLLNVLSGLDELSDGEVRVDGDSIGGMSDRKRTRFRAEKMGFIFQSYNLIPVLSAVENVELPLLVAGKKQKKARRWALDALEMVGLPEQANKRPSEMSGGQQQRVTVARSLVNNPSIVWADEPTGALDSETSKGHHGPARPPQRGAAPDLRPRHPRRRRGRPRPPHDPHARRQHHERRAEREGRVAWRASSASRRRSSCGFSWPSSARACS